MLLILHQGPGRSRMVGLPHYFLGSSCGNHPASLIAASGSEVDHIVAGPDEAEVVLDHQHRVALVRQGAEHFHEALDIGVVEAGRRFIEDEERGAAVGPEWVVGKRRSFVLTQ